MNLLRLNMIYMFIVLLSIVKGRHHNESRKFAHEMLTMLHLPVISLLFRKPIRPSPLKKALPFSPNLSSIVFTPPNKSFTEFIYSLLLFQRTNKQLSILLSYDIAIQALNNHLAFIGYMNHAVLVFIQSDFLAYAAAI